MASGGGGFGAAQFAVANFGYDVGNWRVESTPRMVADITGDGKADIVGFGNDGVWTAVASSGGFFAASKYVLANFGYNQAWRVESHPRMVADITGDDKADIVGFGDLGGYPGVALGDGGFKNFF